MQGTISQEENKKRKCTEENGKNDEAFKKSFPLLKINHCKCLKYFKISLIDKISFVKKTTPCLEAN